MSEGSLRSRFTHNVAKSVVGEDELRERLQQPDQAKFILHDRARVAVLTHE